MLKFNIKLFVYSPPQKKKLTMAHLSPSVDRDRGPCCQALGAVQQDVVQQTSFQLRCTVNIELSARICPGH